ncbi:MAG: valine--tRNA ligase, partial [Proteobacteria bacterium]|nr:valine--tRNA ligase [Pseudomonadota bacterium]
MEKTYNPHEIEQRWYEFWEKNHFFQPSGKGQPYCIMIPPPNVTGRLHMGHGFQNSLMDALIRYHRMAGNNTLWQMGTDHAGIATQMVVERQLAEKNISRHDMGREAFVDRVWQWKEESGNTISQQLRRIGVSVDWSRERFTMDDTLSEAVKEVFIQLYNEGLIYRGKRLVNWDPKFLTAISDLEVISEEENGHLWYIRYPLLDSSDSIVVATTRPETLLGDTAVAVNPDDERYQAFIGKQIKHPLTNRTIPIIADTYVEPTFGTGCVKITPAHDFNDYEMGKRHNLPLINVFMPDAHMNDEVPEPYRGLERYKARKKIIDDLTDLQLLEKVEPHKLKVPRGDRSGVVVEPYLTDQWYVKMGPLAEPAIKVVEEGQIKFIPDNWTKTYNQWMNNIEDWCISRQLWWGHRIPAWYDSEGKVYVGHNEIDVRNKHKLSDDHKLTQDDDVLDTWFSSALWPFSTLGWPKKTNELKTFFPTNVLVTGFDIIFFWVARMIMMSLKFTGKIPFREVYITGLIRDAEGQKMSKSKGNILDPIDLIDGIALEPLIAKRTHGLMQPKMAKQIETATRKEFPNGIASHGTDAVRFTYCALATTGRDIRFDLNRLEGNRNFCNKLWNAARYVLMNTQEEMHDLGDGPVEFSASDRWIKSQLQHLIQHAHQHFVTYRFDLLAKELYEFIWGEYCDWYLELSKPVLTSEEESAAAKRGTRLTLLEVLETLLRLLHPLMPYITEEIWQRIAPLLGKNGDSIVSQSYPQMDRNAIDENIVAEIEWVKTIVLGIRNIRGEMNISPKKLLPVYFYKGAPLDKKRLDNYESLLLKLANLESITWFTPKDVPPPSAMALAGQMEILIPLAGLIDKEAETARLNKEIEKIKKEMQKIEGR